MIFNILLALSCIVQFHSSALHASSIKIINGKCNDKRYASCSQNKTITPNPNLQKLLYHGQLIHQARLEAQLTHQTGQNKYNQLPLFLPCFIDVKIDAVLEDRTEINHGLKSYENRVYAASTYELQTTPQLLTLVDKQTIASLSKQVSIKSPTSVARSSSFDPVVGNKTSPGKKVILN